MLTAFLSRAGYRRRTGYPYPSKGVLAATRLNRLLSLDLNLLVGVPDTRDVAEPESVTVRSLYIGPRAGDWQARVLSWQEVF